jgi:hypothetical protein
VFSAEVWHTIPMFPNLRVDVLALTTSAGVLWDAPLYATATKLFLPYLFWHGYTSSFADIGTDLRALTDDVAQRPFSVCFAQAHCTHMRMQVVSALQQRLGAEKVRVEGLCFGSQRHDGPGWGHDYPGALLCVCLCAVLSWPVLPVLSSPVLSCPLLSSPVLSCPLLSSPILSWPLLSCPLLSSPVLSFPFGLLSSPGLSALSPILPYPLRHVTSRHVTSRHVTSRHVTSRHVTSRHVTSRHVRHVVSGCVAWCGVALGVVWRVLVARICPLRRSVGQPDSLRFGFCCFVGFNKWRECKAVVALENGNEGVGYMTEKLMNGFLAGALPLYGGDRHGAVAHSIFNSAAFLDIRDFYADGDKTHLWGAHEINAPGPVLSRLDLAAVSAFADAVANITENDDALRRVRREAVGKNMTDLNLKLRWAHNGAAGFEAEAALLRSVVRSFWPPHLFKVK